MNQQQPGKTTNDWKLPQLDQQRCTSCGICVQACPTQALEMADALPVFARPQHCTYCTICESVCPSEAIQCAFTVVWDEED